MNNSLPAFVVSLLAIAGVVFVLFRGPSVLTVPEPIPVARSASAEHRNVENFYGDITVGSNRIASSTSASVTLAGNEFKNAGIFDYTVNVGTRTLTFPASTTPMCTNLNINERRVVFIRHATTTSNNVLTFADGTGFKIISASSTKTLYARSDGYALGKFDVLRLISSDCIALFTPAT